MGTRKNVYAEPTKPTISCFFIFDHYYSFFLARAAVP